MKWIIFWHGWIFQCCCISNFNIHYKIIAAKKVCFVDINWAQPRNTKEIGNQLLEIKSIIAAYLEPFFQFDGKPVIWSIKHIEHYLTNISIIHFVLNTMSCISKDVQSRLLKQIITTVFYISFNLSKLILVTQLQRINDRFAWNL